MSENTEYKVIVDTTAAEKAINDLTGAVTKLDENMGKAGNSGKASIAKFTELKSALSLLKGAADELFKTLKRGDEFNDAAAAFDKLTKKAGILSSEFLGNLQKATDGTIDNFTLMTEANRALTAGLSPEAFTAVAAEAKKYAEATGQDAGEATKKLTLAIAQGKTAALENFGVLKDGKIVLSALAEAQNELASGQQGASQGANQLAASLKNATDQVASALDKNVVLKEVIGQVITAVKDMAIAFTDILGEALGGIETGLQKVADQFVVWKYFQENIKGGLSYWKAYDFAVQEVAAMQGLAAESAKKAAEAQKNLNNELGKGKEGLGKYKPLVLDVKKSASELAAEQKKAEDALKKFNLEVAKASSPSGLKGFISDLKEAYETQKAGIISNEEYAEALKKVKAEMDRLDVSAEDQSRVWKKFGEDVDKGKSTWGNFLDTLSLGSVADVAGGISNFIQTIGNAITGTTADVVKGVGATIGAAIGAYYGGPQGAQAGAEAGAAIGGLVTQITAVFNKNSKATIARKAVDKFFIDLFDGHRIQALINGQLKIISDLDFGGAQAGSVLGGYFKSLDALPPKIKGVFNSVGDAFAILSGQFDILGHNVGAALANNIGGSLLDLKGLIQATGKSFEDLSNSIIQAFLDSRLSFVEAQTDLINLQKAFEVGIPDAVGATVQSFKDLQEAGVTGGRRSVNSLKNLGAEAEEINLTTINALAANLLKSGELSAEQVKIFQRETTKLGITTTEQLKTITDAQALTILSNLQTVGFGFKEAQSQASDTINQLSKIPDQTTKKINFVVDVSYTDNAKSSTSQAAIRAAGVKVPVGVSNNV